MFPYIILLLLVLLFGFFLCELRPGRRNDAIFLAVTCGVLFFFSIIRAPSVGVDYELYYLPYFKDVCEGGLGYVLSAANIYRFEPGFSLLIYLISLISPTQFAFAVGVAAPMLALTGIFLYRHSPSVWMSMFIFVSFGFFGYTLCTLRQQLAICIMMFALPYLQKKRLLPYLFVVVLAAMFHKSLWLMLPVYWLAWIPLNWKSITIYSVGTLAALALTEPILNFVTQFVFKHYTADNYYRALGRNFQTAFIPIALFFVSVLLSKALLRRNPANLPLINIAGYSCFLFILTLKTFIFQRVALIFLPVAVVLCSELLLCMKPSAEKTAELAHLKLEGGNKKQQAQKYLQLKSEVKDAQAMYYATMGFLVFSGWLYYMFLLVANRLLLVPYGTILS